MLLFFTWIVTRSNFPWFIFPLAVWGLLLGAHAILSSRQNQFQQVTQISIHDEEDISLPSQGTEVHLYPDYIENLKHSPGMNGDIGVSGDVGIYPTAPMSPMPSAPPHFG